MAIARHFGSPDLFLTMTCNPAWKEIIDLLPPGQRGCDRPDIQVRVFAQKLHHLFKLLREKKIFGPVAAICYTIEFQKRGLPHAHILVILEKSARPLEPADIDNMICAEIPDPQEDSLLYDVVR